MLYKSQEKEKEPHVLAGLTLLSASCAPLRVCLGAVRRDGQDVPLRFTER